jgi:hypothetical protein
MDTDQTNHSFAAARRYFRLRASIEASPAQALLLSRRLMAPTGDVARR